MFNVTCLNCKWSGDEDDLESVGECFEGGYVCPNCGCSDTILDDDDDDPVDLDNIGYEGGE